MLKAYTTVSFLVALDLVSLGCSPSSGRVVRAGSTDSGGGSNSNPGGGTTSNITPNQDGGYIVSTSGGSGGVGGGTDCGRSNFPVQQKPADVLLVLDRSASMVENSTPTKWANVVPALHGVIDATASSLSWGLKVFPVGTDAQCTQGTYPSGVVVNIAANNANAMDTAIDATLPTGNGTPTADAINEAVKYLQTLQDGNPKYILLATDGEPSCNGMTGSTDSTGARLAAIAAVTAAAAPGVGIHTFVVGVATSKDTASATLNSMAIAGLEPLPATSATSYYMATTQSALVTAFNSITAVVKTCLFPLTSPPPAPDHVNVSVDTTKIAFDPARANGWNFTGSDMLTIQLYGTACDLATTSGAAAVQVVFGCLNDILIIT